ncbi:hypothetical protein [Haloglycomyces albus]|uniref:hypothetical protein n=1 Tax=Haloglycomyces albus TaxID=526067 RepID=UPI00046D1568|nr:hypothetical protein [Haloglycomyces albus]
MGDGNERRPREMLTFERLQQLKLEYTRYRISAEKSLSMVRDQADRKATDLRSLQELAPELFWNFDHKLKSVRNASFEVEAQVQNLIQCLNDLSSCFERAALVMDAGEVDYATVIVANGIKKVRHAESALRLKSEETDDRGEPSPKTKLQFNSAWAAKYRQKIESHLEFAHRIANDASARDENADAVFARFPHLNRPKGWASTQQGALELRRLNDSLMATYSTAHLAVRTLEERIAAEDGEGIQFAGTLVFDLCANAHVQAEAALGDRWDVES